MNFIPELGRAELEKGVGGLHPFLARTMSELYTTESDIFTLPDLLRMSKVLYGESEERKYGLRRPGWAVTASELADRLDGFARGEKKLSEDTQIAVLEAIGVMTARAGQMRRSPGFGAWNDQREKAMVELTHVWGKGHGYSIQGESYAPVESLLGWVQKKSRAVESVQDTNHVDWSELANGFATDVKSRVIEFMGGLGDVIDFVRTHPRLALSQGVMVLILAACRASGRPTARPEVTPIVPTEHQDMPTPTKIEPTHAVLLATEDLATPTIVAPSPVAPEIVWSLPARADYANDPVAVLMRDEYQLRDYLKKLGWSQDEMDAYAGFYRQIRADRAVGNVLLDCDANMQHCLFYGTDSEGYMLWPQGGDYVAEYPYIFDEEQASAFGKLTRIPDSKGAKIVIVGDKPLVTKGEVKGSDGKTTFEKSWNPFTGEWESNVDVAVSVVSTPESAPNVIEAWSMGCYDNDMCMDLDVVDGPARYQELANAFVVSYENKAWMASMGIKDVDGFMKFLKTSTHTDPLTGKERVGWVPLTAKDGKSKFTILQGNGSATGAIFSDKNPAIVEAGGFFFDKVAFVAASKAEIDANKGGVADWIKKMEQQNGRNVLIKTDSSVLGETWGLAVVDEQLVFVGLNRATVPDGFKQKNRVLGQVDVNRDGQIMSAMWELYTRVYEKFANVKDHISNSALEPDSNKWYRPSLCVAGSSGTCEGKDPALFVSEKALFVPTTEE